jgi:peptidase E
MGGGGFTMRELTPALDRFALTLTGKAVPRICFLPTASGDPREQVTRFYERFGDWPCEPSVLPLFRLREDRIDPIAHLLAQDVIYVGGGSMRNMLAIWREHGIDGAMWTAWESGTVLAGVSAGAMCWFQGGISTSAGVPAPVRGLGLLAGSLSVHLDGESERLPAYRAAIAAGELPPGYAADDGAALLFEGVHLAECVASRPAARVLRLRPDGTGGVEQEAVSIRRLAGRERCGPEQAAPYGVSELRALRAGRRRWD